MAEDPSKAPNQNDHDSVPTENHAPTNPAATGLQSSRTDEPRPPPRTLPRSAAMDRLSEQFPPYFHDISASEIDLSRSASRFWSTRIEALERNICIVQSNMFQQSGRRVATQDEVQTMLSWKLREAAACETTNFFAPGVFAGLLYGVFKSNEWYTAWGYEPMPKLPVDSWKAKIVRGGVKACKCVWFGAGASLLYWASVRGYYTLQMAVDPRLQQYNQHEYNQHVGSE